MSYNGKTSGLGPDDESSILSIPTMETNEPILQFFAYDHLPPHLRLVSKMFSDLAFHVNDVIPRNAERTVALRKLLEAKDAAVRAVLSK